MVVQSRRGWEAGADPPGLGGQGSGWLPCRWPAPGGGWGLAPSPAGRQRVAATALQPL